LFGKEQNNKNFSESKQIYRSMATTKTSNIQLVHRHFSNEKCVDRLNQCFSTFRRKDRTLLFDKNFIRTTKISFCVRR